MRRRSSHPGRKKVYTNANTNLLGAVVEQATGQQFADVLDERILRPLGLEGTEYVLDAAQWADPHPLGYAEDEGGLEEQPDNLSIFGPAGSMISNLDDGRVWGEVLATGMLLQPETQAERQQGAPLDVGPPYDIYALGIGETAGWWGHNGEGLGFTAAIFHNPDSRDRRGLHERIRRRAGSPPCRSDVPPYGRDPRIGPLTHGPRHVRHVTPRGRCADMLVQRIVESCRTKSWSQTD